MSGKVIYAPRNDRHECNPGSEPVIGSRLVPVGAVWRCECGAYWRVEPVPLMTFARWYRLRGLRLWWWKRRHPECVPDDHRA